MKKATPLFALTVLLALVSGIGPAWACDKGHASHVMTGKVTKIDNKTGMVSVKTGAATLEIHFMPAEIKDIKSGDAVEVGMTIKKGAAGTEHDHKM